MHEVESWVEGFRKFGEGTRMFETLQHSSMSIALPRMVSTMNSGKWFVTEEGKRTFITYYR